MTFLSKSRSACALALSMALGVAQAKPIAFQGGTSAMAEYGGSTMQEAQVFYAPRYWYSLGGGHLRLQADDNSFTHNTSYVRANFLLKRWNLSRAQANIFAYGGLGNAQLSGQAKTLITPNFGAQADYETLRFYSSARSDWQSNSAFTHSINTVQLGAAPYRHEFGGLATWGLLQARSYTGGIQKGIETAALIRLFTGTAWVEAGITNHGQLQTMLMFNF